jgi:dihydrodipicolinate synthase/N-acetylneuraminate lyase
MKLLGRDSGQLRLPMTELEESEFARLRMVLENYGFRL